MLTKEQQEWIDHLSDNKVVIVPYDPRAPEFFVAVEKRIRSVLGSGVVICHCGASSLGISGQDEIDVTIEAKKADLERYRLLKEDGNGLTTKEYYRRKTEFANEIMKKAAK